MICAVQGGEFPRSPTDDEYHVLELFLNGTTVWSKYYDPPNDRPKAKR